MALIAPHGADALRPLIVADTRRAELEAEALTLPSLMLSSAAAANAVMMAAGYFTPLTGYMNRADAPLCPADDAMYLDTTDLSIDEAVAKAIELIEAKRG